MYRSGFSAAIARSNLNFRYDELKKATGNFNRLNKVGQGSYGIVFKRKSQRNSESRSKVKTLHTAEFRSFAAQFSIMQADEQHATPSQADLYRQRHYNKKNDRWITDYAEETHVIENLLGKRVARKQGYRSRSPSSSSTSILVSSKMSTLRQQLVDSLKAQEELRRQYEESQKQMQD